MTVEATKEQGKYTAATLEQDREKLKRIDQGLDEVQGELELSRVLMTRFLKRLCVSLPRPLAPRARRHPSAGRR